MVPQTILAVAFLMIMAGALFGVAPGDETQKFPQTTNIISSLTAFSWEDVDKISDGMTQNQVIAILGKPYARAEVQYLDILTVNDVETAFREASKGRAEAIFIFSGVTHEAEYDLFRYTAPQNVCAVAL